MAKTNLPRSGKKRRQKVDKPQGGATPAMPYEQLDTRITYLGTPKVESPIRDYSMVNRDGRVIDKSYVQDTDRILVYDSRDYLESLGPAETPLYFEMAGPRPHIYFDPPTVHCAVAT